MSLDITKNVGSVKIIQDSLLVFCTVFIAAVLWLAVVSVLVCVIVAAWHDRNTRFGLDHKTNYWCEIKSFECNCTCTKLHVESMNKIAKNKSDKHFIQITCHNSEPYLSMVKLLRGNLAWMCLGLSTWSSTILYEMTRNDYSSNEKKLESFCLRHSINPFANKKYIYRKLIKYILNFCWES